MANEKLFSRGKKVTLGPLSFKETDLVRAIKSAIKAGLHVAQCGKHVRADFIVDTGTSLADTSKLHR